jgi:uncharacterized protein (DUF1697 family)
MNTYIAFLRGINVLGKNMIRMDALKQMFEELHLDQARTYIQSGNVVFSASAYDETELEVRISEQIRRKTGFEVRVLVLAREDMHVVIAKNPYAGVESKDPAHLHVTLLGGDPVTVKIEDMRSKQAPGEEFTLYGRAVYLYLPHGYGRTKLNNNIFEKILNVKATTRNWRTMLELAKMAGEAV